MINIISIPALTTYIHYFIILSQCNRAKRNEKHKIEEKERKLSLFIDYLIIYRENPKPSLGKLQKLLSEFSILAV